MVLRLPRAPPSSICFRCFFQLSKPRRGFSTSLRRGTGVASIAQAAPGTGAVRGAWQKQYFLANKFLGVKRGDGSRQNAVDPAITTSAFKIPEDLPPHRRRQLRNKLEKEGIIDHNAPLPPDASSLLSTSSAESPIGSLKRLIFPYLALSKPRLTALIVLSAMAPYALYPVDPLLSAATTSAPTLSALTLTFLTVGTALASSSANAFNMYLEPAYDRQMSRTRNRPLVRGLLQPRQALVFAIATGVIGVGALYVGVNPTVAALGAANIFLYAAVYTPLKRISVINTWVGAVVGGIPPLMGWAAAAGATQGVDSGMVETLSHPGGWLLAGLLFAWQFPHFNSLSWTIREEYKAAGYQMMVWKYPRLNGRVAVRYSFLFFPICVGLWWVGVTDVGFLATSSVVNTWLVREAWRFYRKAGEGGSAKKLFWASVWHLPVLMGLAMVHKAGLWKGVWDRVTGAEEEWEEEEEYEEDGEEEDLKEAAKDSTG